MNRFYVCQFRSRNKSKAESLCITEKTQLGWALLEEEEREKKFSVMILLTEKKKKRHNLKVENYGFLKKLYLFLIGG